MNRGTKLDSLKSSSRRRADLVRLGTVVVSVVFEGYMSFIVLRALPLPLHLKVVLLN